MVRAAFRWPALYHDRRLWRPADNGEPRSRRVVWSAQDRVPAPTTRASAPGTGGVRERSESIRFRADELLDRSAALIERSRALRERIGRRTGPKSPSSTSKITSRRGFCARDPGRGRIHGQGIGLGGGRHAGSTGDPPIRLVLLDVGLPDGDGFQLCGQIKAQRADVPVVMITSIYRSASARRQGLDLGADEYLLEPLPGHRLIGTIDRLLMESPPGSRPAIITTDGSRHHPGAQ